jgi:hypothetical protein
MTNQNTTSAIHSISETLLIQFYNPKTFLDTKIKNILKNDTKPIYKYLYKPNMLSFKCEF